MVEPLQTASVPVQVWDSLGRLLYQSAPQDHVVTAVAWSPSSDLFAVGSFNTVSLCGRSGSAFSKVSSILQPAGPGLQLSIDLVTLWGAWSLRLQGRSKLHSTEEMAGIAVKLHVGAVLAALCLLLDIGCSCGGQQAGSE